MRVEGVAGRVRRARTAQTAWRETPVRDRVVVLRRFRRAFVERAETFVAGLGSVGKPAAEAIASEIVPVADACRFLERRAARILGDRRLGSRDRPVWLGGVRSSVARDPYGVVLVVGPSNYPLQLPAIQTLQAIAGGNAVVLKPGANGHAVAESFRTTLVDAGLDPDLVAVLGERTEAVAEAVEAGVEKIVLTGSRETGRVVHRLAAVHGIPCTMELSGCDACFVLDSADLDRTAWSIAYGMTLNGGRTCIAPRRVFVSRSLATPLAERLVALLDARDGRYRVDPTTAIRVHGVLEDALQRGGTLLRGGVSSDFVDPIVIGQLSAHALFHETDVFAPVVGMVPYDDLEDALAIDERCPFGLGASIFGDEREAKTLADRLDVGGVTVNDVVVPTADPRLPFGGRRGSGFSVTRGVEGLLAMTRPKVVAVRSGRARHLEPMARNAEAMRTLLTALHGPTLWSRVRGWCRLATLPNRADGDGHAE